MPLRRDAQRHPACPSACHRSLNWVKERTARCFAAQRRLAGAMQVLALCSSLCLSRVQTWSMAGRKRVPPTCWLRQSLREHLRALPTARSQMVCAQPPLTVLPLPLPATTASAAALVSGAAGEKPNTPGMLVRILMHALEHMCSQPPSLPLAPLLQAWPLQAALLRLCEHMRSVLHAGRSLRPLCAPGTLGMSSAHQKTTLLTRCQTSSCMLCLRWAMRGVI